MDFYILPSSASTSHMPQWPILLRERMRNHLLDLRGYPAGWMEERGAHWLPDTGPYMTINIPALHVCSEEGRPGDSSIAILPLHTACLCVCDRGRSLSQTGSKGGGLNRLPFVHNSSSLSGDGEGRPFPSSCHPLSRSPKLLWSRRLTTPSHAHTKQWKVTSFLS